MENLMLAALLGLVAPTTAPVFLAHYMPWYESKEVSGNWGWHWTMNHFNPDKKVGDRQEAASQFRPLMGLYDSGDPAALECHCLLMKLSGIGGVLVDWYGIGDLYDYPIVHRNTQRLIDAAKKAGLTYAMVYEDQTVPNLIREKKVPADKAIDHGKETMRWLDDHWFRDPGYQRIDGKPVLLVFGPQYYKDGDWPGLFATLKNPPAFFTLLGKRDSAFGAYGWPEPQVGDAKSWTQLEGYYERAKGWPASIPGAWPRFVDIYAEAGNHPSWGTIKDQNGETYRKTLDMAIKSHAPYVQLVTWNDWGEGTQIEPSVEFGYRDLEATQAARRKLDGAVFKFPSADLRLPLRLYKLRKRPGTDAKKLDEISALIVKGDLKAARNRLDAVDRGR